jgi:hypothetical protein
MKIRLIVPQTGGGRSIDPIAAYGLSIAHIAGGFTAHKATGGWIESETCKCRDSDGKLPGGFHRDDCDLGRLIVEPVMVFDCGFAAFYRSAYEEDSDQNPVCTQVEQFRLLTKRIGRELHQDCVYLEVDGRVELVKP